MGGVHGDEPAGAAAAQRIRTWSIERGTLVVIPRANQPALRAKTRFSPRTQHPDLARCFPRSETDRPRGELAPTLWRIIVRLHPDWLVDLHEGWGVHRLNPETLGSTVMHGPSPENVRQAQRMVEAANAHVADPRHRFTPLERFIVGSSVFAANRWLGIPCLVQESTRIGRPLSLRVRAHEAMTRQLLSDLGMV